jgi:hypothetical protein
VKGADLSTEKSAKDGTPAPDAITTYVRALVDVATVLEAHREARSDFEPGFLIRSLRDGFLQPVSTADRNRILEQADAPESFLLWRGGLRQPKMAWNCIGWIFPFTTEAEMERSYEIVIRAEIVQKSWPQVRHFLLSCRKRLQEMPIVVPTNLVKVRIKGQTCGAAMQALEQTPPNVRYVARAMLAQLPPSNYLRQRMRLNLVVGEQLQPYIKRAGNEDNRNG